MMFGRGSLVLCGMMMLASCDTDPVFSPALQLGAFELTHRNGAGLPQATNFPWPYSTGFATLHSIDGGTLDLGSQHDYRLSLNVQMRGLPEVIVLGEGQATFTPYTVMIPLSDGRTVTGNYGPRASRNTITLFLGEPWGTLIFTRSNSLDR
jgi:hypothetical protein